MTWHNRLRRAREWSVELGTVVVRVLRTSNAYRFNTPQYRFALWNHRLKILFLLLMKSAAAQPERHPMKESARLGPIMPFNQIINRARV